MSFGESMFSAGFILKTNKVNPIIKFNRAYLQQKQYQKTLEDTRRLHRRSSQEADRGLASPTCKLANLWPHQSAPPSYVSFPPP
jgi:hypothetical protein